MSMGTCGRCKTCMGVTSLKDMDTEECKDGDDGVKNMLVLAAVGGGVGAAYRELGGARQTG